MSSNDLSLTVIPNHPLDTMNNNTIDMRRYIITNQGPMLYARFVAILSRGDAY